MGYVACHVTYNVLGIGADEHSWRAVKQLKSDNRAHLCIEYVERQSVIFGAASLHDSRAICKNAEAVESMDTSNLWNDEDAVYDLGLGNFGVDDEDLQRPLPPVRVFYWWLEDWETVLLKKNDQLAEAKLLKKYKRLQLYDPQHDVKYNMLPFNLEVICNLQSCGWNLFVAPPGYDDYGEHDDDISR
jgi:hypothetical protein